MSARRRLLLACLCLLSLGAAFGGGWFLGAQRGERAGFAIGKRYGEVQAAKVAPTPVTDRGHAVDALRASSALRGLPLLDEEWVGFTALLNRAMSPCRVAARKGASLATSAVEPAAGCAGLETQAALALAAYRTFVVGRDGDAARDGQEEALAALRIERRLPVPRGDADALVRGNPEAAVTLTAFTDYQCPYCARGESLIEEILAARGQELRVVVRHLPLTRIHPAAFPTAVAVEAARLQGKGMEMHTAVFALGGRALGELVEAVPDGAPGSPFAAQALALGLDGERFARDSADPATAARVQADLDLAEQLGVRGTPAFFFDGREATEGRSVEAFSLLLDKALAERDWRFSWGLEPAPSGVGAP